MMEHLPSYTSCNTYQPSRRVGPRSLLPSVHPLTAVWSRTASLFELPHWVFGLRGAQELGYSGLVGVGGETNKYPLHAMSILSLLCYICAKVVCLSFGSSTIQQLHPAIVGKSRRFYHASDIIVNSGGQRVGRGPGP